MLRQLLTLLALLTGLAASGAQAEVRLSGMDDVRLEAQESQSIASVSHVLHEVAVRPARKAKSPEAGIYRPGLRAMAVVPTVILGSDRARE